MAEAYEQPTSHIRAQLGHPATQRTAQGEAVAEDRRRQEWRQKEPTPGRVATTLATAGPITAAATAKPTVAAAGHPTAAAEAAKSADAGCAAAECHPKSAAAGRVAAERGPVAAAGADHPGAADHGCPPAAACAAAAQGSTDYASETSTTTSDQAISATGS